MRKSESGGLKRMELAGSDLKRVSKKRKSKKMRELGESVREMEQ